MKEINEKIKIEEMIKLSEKMLKLLPHNSISIMIHDIDFKNLDSEKWKMGCIVSGNTKTADIYYKKGEKCKMQITVFSK